MDDTRSWVRAVDIFRTMGRADRIRILLFLQSGRQAVSDLTNFIHGDTYSNHCTQTSAALAPMRRLGLVKQIRSKKFVFYELTDLGREVIRLINRIQIRRKTTISKSAPNGEPDVSP